MTTSAASGVQNMGSVGGIKIPGRTNLSTKDYMSIVNQDLAFVFDNRIAAQGRRNNDL